MAQKEAFTLKYPIEVDSVETDTLQLRRPTVADLEAMEGEKTEHKKAIKMISLLSNVPEKTVRTLDVSDYQKISERIYGFLGLGSQEPENF